MKGLPDSTIYEEELQYWPYVTSWKKVIEYVRDNASKSGSLIDLMCGPGYLLGKIAEARKDLALEGIDIDVRYIPHAQKMYPQIDFALADVLTWVPKQEYDVVLCTGSLHHIPYEQQENAVQKMASMVKPGGFVIISDCYIDDYKDEKERKVAAVKLGYEYLRETIQNGAPDSVVEPTIEILWNDVMLKEFKTSLKKRLPIFEKHFSQVKTLKTWPTFEAEYGDRISICRKNNTLL